MNRKIPPLQPDPKHDTDDNFGPNEDGFDQGKPDPVSPGETVPGAFDPDKAVPDAFDPDRAMPDAFDTDEAEPDEFEPEGLPVEPDEGPTPDHIPGDPEHDRVIDPGESWDPRAARTLRFAC